MTSEVPTHSGNRSFHSLWEVYWNSVPKMAKRIFANPEAQYFARGSMTRSLVLSIVST